MGRAAPQPETRMDITAVPFNRLLGLEMAAPGTGFHVSLPAGPLYTNHLGTVHAGVLLTVADAGSAAFLALHFGDGTGLIPVVRRLNRANHPTLSAGVGGPATWRDRLG